MFCLQYLEAPARIVLVCILPSHAYLVDQFMAQCKPAGQTWTTFLTSVSVCRRASSCISRQLPLGKCYP